MRSVLSRVSSISSLSLSLSSSASASASAASVSASVSSRSSVVMIRSLPLLLSTTTSASSTSSSSSTMRWLSSSSSSSSKAKSVSIGQGNGMKTGPQKIVCALYEGGEAGKSNPAILGCVENALGLRPWLESLGHKYVVTSSKDGNDSVLARELKDADIVISQPFWPAYITQERIASAPNLKLAITAGIGSDHVDLEAACQRNITVAEVTGSNTVSVAEHVVMQILALVRNFVPAHKQVINGQWDIAGIVNHAWDLEGKNVGTVGAGRIGKLVLQRLKPFGVKLHYYDYQRMSSELEKELDVVYHSSPESLAKACDIVTINAPLHPGTENLFDAKMIANMKKGSYIVNTARGKIMDRDALVDALKSGHLEGYAGDVWFPQPAAPDHPWRSMPRHAMTPHYSGTTLTAQARYAAGTKEILERYFNGQAQRPEYLIADGGKITTRSYTPGNTTKGSL